MALIRICDVCESDDTAQQKSLVISYSVSAGIAGMPTRAIDLCAGCHEKLIKWLEGHAIIDDSEEESEDSECKKEQDDEVVNSHGNLRG